jgi:hypothetical protein
MASEIAVVAAVSKYSSTTNKPAMSAFRNDSPQWLLPIQLKDTVLSVNAVEAVVLETTPFTVMEHTLVDAR